MPQGLLSRVLYPRCYMFVTGCYIFSLYSLARGLKLVNNYQVFRLYCLCIDPITWLIVWGSCFIRSCVCFASVESNHHIITFSALLWPKPAWPVQSGITETAASFSHATTTSPPPPLFRPITHKATYRKYLSRYRKPHSSIKYLSLI